MNNPLPYLSLFSGAGGIDLALDRVGMTCVAQCEIDKQAVSVLRRHWPDVKRFNDVRRIRSRSVPRVDLVCGGFPCQDVSVAGRRAGLAGERSGLWYEFYRIIRAVAPAWVLIENVPGLLSSRKGKDLAAILEGLAELGYGWAYRVLDAQYFGLAQRRNRVWIVGRAGGDVRSAAEVLFERESLPWDSPPSREAGARVAASLTAGVASSSGVNRPGRRREDDENLAVVGPLCSHDKAHGHAMGTQQAAEAEQLIVNCLDAHMGMGGVDDNSAQANHLVPVAVAHALRGEGFDASEDGTGRGTPLVPVGYIHPRQLRNSQSSNQVGIKPNAEVADALTSEGPGAVMQKHGVRRLMPIECERLQGLPDGWTEYGVNESGETVQLSDSARYRLIGNGVAVPNVEWFGRRIVEVANG